MMHYMNLLDRIGDTPLIRINRLNPFNNVLILAKVESFNPGGSVKDRIAYQMIKEAEESGALTKDKVVLEATSGNTGIGMAMVCAVKGYRCQLVMPESASIERRKIMKAYGAEIILTPAKRSTDGAIEQAYAMAREHQDRYYLTDQFNNDANWRSHFLHTGPEIWEQTKGEVTDVVATLGTSGTVMGLCNYFSEHHPHVQVTAMEPFYGHKIQGLKNMKESYKPGIFDKNKPSQIINVVDEDAFEMARRLAREEGIFVGMSSGAAMCAALKRAEKMEKGTLVVIFPDGGERYLSTQLFTSEQPQVEVKPPEVRFFNSLKRRKEVFRPQNQGKVTFYACGPTAYENANLGHCRRFVVADLISRLLSERGYKVEYYMNFTDLDDNTIAGAEKNNKSLGEFTSGYIAEFLDDIEALGVRKATSYPLASQHVEQMLDIAKELVAKGYAYEKHGSVYFNIAKFPRYGKLSRVDLGKIKVGKTVDLDNYDKNSPVDFTLLKRSTLGELKNGIFYKTEWGNVRPGWHIECAAMSLHLFGQTMDIHTSGRDLIFPHHENENAIAEAVTGKPLANYWLHSELLTVEGKKMSLEQGNVVTLRDVVAKGYTPRQLRFFLLSAHYRKPIDFSYKRLDQACRSLKRLDDFIRKLICMPPELPHPDIARHLTIMEEGFEAAMNDDMNISKGLGSVFDFIKKAHPVINEGMLDLDQKQYIIESLTKINTILNVMRLEQGQLSPEIDKLLQMREQARKDKDWAKADEVRAQLAALGITVSDTGKGPVWKEQRRKIK